MRVGIVGLPNIGKSTLFNALTRTTLAQAANYPFCTAEPNKASCPIPDAQLEVLAGIASSEKIVRSTVDFVDIAGLVRGASKGDGLGNKFLANIRDQVDVLIHVVRGFDDTNISHVDGTTGAVRDIETVNTELQLADLEVLERRRGKSGGGKKGGKGAPLLDIDPLLEEPFLDEVAGALDDGRSALWACHAAATAAAPESAEAAEVDAKLRADALGKIGLITCKPTMHVLNVGEDECEPAAHAEIVSEVAAHLEESDVSSFTRVFALCATVEQELGEIADAEERAELIEAYGMAESGLDAVLRASVDLLHLQPFFTVGPKEAHAWSVRRGTPAVEAAGKIHSDIERGFIRAEVIGYDDFVEHGGESGAKAAGKARLEGKDYVMQSGDVVHFRFNV